MDEQDAQEIEQSWHEKLLWFVSDAPLYTVVKIRHKLWNKETTAEQIMPRLVSMPCVVCELTTNWGGKGGMYNKAGSLHSIQYSCQNCTVAKVTIYYWWRYVEKETHFEKVGRWPKFEISPPKELGKALGKDHLVLYRRGMTSRHHGFGLGALVYFRRIVEETTGELLDLLETAVQETGGDEAALETIKEAKSKKAFDDKVKVAANALPSHIRLGGVNPLDLLHDLLSDGMHARTDEEAIEIVDGIEEVLEYLFTELKAHAEKRKGFAEGIKEIMGRLSARKKPAG